MNDTIDKSCQEYKNFVEEFYPKSNFNFSQNRRLIEKLFKLIEITDVFLDFFKDSNFTDHLSYLKHQLLLMLFHLPNYNSFFISAIKRSISENILRMTLVSIGQDIENANNMPFFRIQEKLKEVAAYRNNQNSFKTSCDSLFSYFGANSQIIHSNPTTQQSHLSYIVELNEPPFDSEVQKFSKFLNVINEYFLVSFSKHNQLNDLTMSLANKIQMKSILGSDSYHHYFDNIHNESSPSFR
ncbi:hypothetical protein [Bacillus sp. P14.5]|uniref:hypothetical protein n=1 Tax=Bacillus sp. P14.5 TaxID=1983400 RepID=UPI000DEA2C89|nr:hypothetical protein [Bacillus sp. P14.5]